MATSACPVKMHLVSGAYWQRIGLWPMAAFLGVSWLFVIVWLVTCALIFQYNQWWSIIIFASTVLFSVFLSYMTRKMVTDAYKEFVLELTEDEAVLTVVDRISKRASTQMVLLDDIKFAEYYPYRDSECIIFHAPYTDMEVPLWPMGNHGRDVLDFLDGRGVKVINVQSDEKFPD